MYLSLPAKGKRRERPLSRSPSFYSSYSASPSFPPSLPLPRDEFRRDAIVSPNDRGYRGKLIHRSIYYHPFLSFLSFLRFLITIRSDTLSPERRTNFVAKIKGRISVFRSEAAFFPPPPLFSFSFFTSDSSIRPSCFSWKAQGGGGKGDKFFSPALPLSGAERKTPQPTANRPILRSRLKGFNPRLPSRPRFFLHR